jgi:phosphate transport system substrate-binding protein
MNKTMPALLACLLAAPPLSPAGRISILGSDTMLILNQEWKLAYEKDHPGVRIDVEGGGSGRGIAALLDESVDIVAASRAIKDEEIARFAERVGSPPLEIPVQIDGIGVYVHYNNPLMQLSMDQLRGILSGRIRNWKDIGGDNRRIDVYTRDHYSGTRAMIESHVLRGEPITSLAREVSTTAMMLGTIARNPGAIGYGGIAYLEGARVIRLIHPKLKRAIWPGREDVCRGVYPLSRPLYFYIRPDSIRPEVQEFLDWVLKERGQEVVSFIDEFCGQRTAPAPEPADPTPAGSIRLTPGTMRSHGFVVAVESAGLGDGPRTFHVSFDPDGKMIGEVTGVSLHLGEAVRVPLAPVMDPQTGTIRAVELTLRPDMVAGATLRLDRADPTVAPSHWELRLADFLSGE